MHTTYTENKEYINKGYVCKFLIMTPAQCQNLPKSKMILQIKTLLSFKQTDKRPRRKIRAVDSCSFLRD